MRREKALTTCTDWFFSASDSWWNLYGLMSMSDETWPWYALQTKKTQARDPNQFTQLQYKVEDYKYMALWSQRQLFFLLMWHSIGGVIEQSPSSITYFWRVMISLWPLYCHARRRARSLASDLKFKGARVTFSYSVTTKYTGEVTNTSDTVWRFTSFYEGVWGNKW